MRVRGHAAWVVGALTPERRRRGLVENRAAIHATLRRKAIAQAIGCFCRRRVEKKHRSDGECLEEGSHEGEIRVYPGETCPQQIPTAGAGLGG